MIKKLWLKAIKIQERRAAYWKVQNMTDRELRDIGVERYEIKQKFYSIR